ncbi:unnamed protein product [Colias eurytheme]|nr:unnamed protein product [Colias eurytheme]
MLVDGTICPRSRITNWRDTEPDELYVFFSIILTFGIVQKSRMQEYWSVSDDIFITPGLKNVMSRDRFQLLSKCLHFNDNSELRDLNLSRPQAKLFKIAPLLDHLNTKFSSMYNLSQNIALDESLTLWKGWLNIKHFIPDKTATAGIKSSCYH